MANYIMIYLGGKHPETPEEGQAHMLLWKEWLTKIGEAVVDPGTPLVNPSIVSGAGVVEGAGDSAISGFTVVKADSKEAAIEMAKGCPFLEVEGALHVAEMRRM